MAENQHHMTRDNQSLTRTNYNNELNQSIISSYIIEAPKTAYQWSFGSLNIQKPIPEDVQKTFWDLVHGNVSCIKLIRMNFPKYQNYKNYSAF